MYGRRNAGRILLWEGTVPLSRLLQPVQTSEQGNKHFWLIEAFCFSSELQQWGASGGETTTASKQERVGLPSINVTSTKRRQSSPPSIRFSAPCRLMKDLLRKQSVTGLKPSTPTMQIAARIER